MAAPIPPLHWISHISENSDWLHANDPCTLLLGNSWRLPTGIEWERATTTGGWDNYNEAYASVLNLHAAGYLLSDRGSLYYRGSDGLYWCSSQLDSDNGRYIHFSSGLSGMYYNYKAYGHSARCLRDL